MLRYFTLPRKGLGAGGAPPFAPDLPPAITTWVGQMSSLTGDYLVAIPGEQLTEALANAVERFPEADVRAAAVSRGIEGDPLQWSLA